jgi:hypothetical protein
MVVYRLYPEGFLQSSCRCGRYRTNVAHLELTFFQSLFQQNQLTTDQKANIHLKVKLTDFFVHL